MIKAYKFRAYPNKEQQFLFAKTFGCARFVYNYYLHKKIELYKSSKEGLSFNKCSADLTQLKKELIWLKEVDKWSLQNSLKNLGIHTLQLLLTIVLNITIIKSNFLKLVGLK